LADEKEKKEKYNKSKDNTGKTSGKFDE